jgi:integrase
LGHERVIFLNAKAQAIVRPFLKPDRPTDFIFSPADAKAEHFASRKAKRRTPLTPSQRKRKPMEKPSKRPGLFYTDKAYGHAITVACRKADVEPWHPHQLRHTMATEIRERFGLEAAQVVLGQKNAKVTEIYAERDQKKARSVVSKLGSKVS